jgi:3-dehydroquinate synthase
MNRDEPERVRSLLTTLGLPTKIPSVVNAARLRAAMQFDKKSQRGQRRLVLPVGLGRAIVADDVPESVVDLALQEIGATG